MQTLISPFTHLTAIAQASPGTFAVSTIRACSSRRGRGREHRSLRREEFTGSASALASLEALNERCGCFARAKHDKTDERRYSVPLDRQHIRILKRERTITAFLRRGLGSTRQHRTVAGPTSSRQDFPYFLESSTYPKATPVDCVRGWKAPDSVALEGSKVELICTSRRALAEAQCSGFLHFGTSKNPRNLPCLESRRIAVRMFAGDFAIPPGCKPRASPELGKSPPCSDASSGK